MALTIGAILALLAFAVAVYPFTGRRFLAREDRPGEETVAGDAPEADEQDVPASEELEAIYQAVRTLQLERELGSVPEGLYREQLDAYRLQAALILRAREDTQGIISNSVLEEEIRLARAGLYKPNGSIAVCPNCARPISKEGTNCPECGVTLTDLSIN